MERLQKIIAQAGLCSRRAAEELIAKGRVRVNGRVVTELGAKADPRKDKVEVDNKRIDPENFQYIVLHKPRGYVSTLADPEDRPTVLDLIREIPERLHPVGRLDFATSGVLLMTNDGDLTHKLLHPSTKAPKTYVVKLDKIIDDSELEIWRTGIALEDGITQPAEVRRIRNEQGKSWIEVTLREGRNHQLRRMAAATGFVAMRLARMNFAEIDSEGLKPGQWRPLTVDELRKLKQLFGVPKRVRPQTALFRLLEKLDKRKKEDRRRAKSKAPKQGSVAQRPKHLKQEGGARSPRAVVRGPASTDERDTPRRGDGFARPQVGGRPARPTRGARTGASPGDARRDGSHDTPRRRSGARDAQTPSGDAPRRRGSKPVGDDAPRRRGPKPDTSDAPRRRGSKPDDTSDAPRRRGPKPDTGDAPRRRGSKPDTSDAPRRRGSKPDTSDAPRRRGSKPDTSDAPRRRRIAKPPNADS